MNHKTTSALPKRKLTLLDKFYYIGVGIKGIDGAIELLVGILLIFSPQLAHVILQGAAATVGEKKGHIRQFAAQYLADADDQLARVSLSFLVTYLIVHAVVKLGLVYCLIRKFHRAYPVAILILLIFTVYQAYVFIKEPSVGLAAFTILDGIIVWLVYREYQEIVPERENWFKFRRIRKPEH